MVGEGDIFADLILYGIWTLIYGLLQAVFVTGATSLLAPVAWLKDVAGNLYCGNTLLSINIKFSGA